MNNLLIYYGWLNSFNSASNGWNNQNVANDIAGNYDICVFGDGLQDPDHGDYANTQDIISKIRTANGSLKIFGYVSSNQNLNQFEDKVDDWETLQVDGIFMDESGYDFGVSRDDQNDRIDYVHNNTYANICFINAWNVNHILGTENDPSYPNSTYNSSLTASNLSSSDYYLLENLTIVNSAYEDFAQWFTRMDKAKKAENDFSIKLAAVSVLANSDGDAQVKFNNLYKAAHLLNLASVGSSDTNYGASSAAVTLWTRPSVSHL